MREENPLAVPYLFKEEDAYYFNGPVRGYSGVSRFIIGLMNDVEVIETESLREYLNGLMKSKQF